MKHESLSPLGGQPSRHRPEVMILRPAQLGRERRLFLVAIGLPLLGSLIAIPVAWTVGVNVLDVSLLGVMFVLSVVGIEVGYHRLFSHRAFKTTPSVRAALGIAGATAGQGPVVYWASHHRRHHAHSDEDGDPHSPYLRGEGLVNALRGLYHAHVGWIFGAERAWPGHYAPDLLRDPAVNMVDRYYFTWFLSGITLPGLVAGLVTLTWTGVLEGALWGGVVRVFLVQQGTYSINSLCHAFGTRPFPDAAQSRNNALLALPTLGGSWHNNHHAFPSSATNSFRWWQIDPSAWFIRALCAVGLAWDIRGPASP